MVHQFQAIGLGQGFLTDRRDRRDRRRPLPAAAARRHPRRGAADLRDGRRAGRHPRPCGQRRRRAGRPSFTATSYPDRATAPAQADPDLPSARRVGHLTRGTVRGSIPGVADQRLLLAAQHDQDDAEHAGHRRGGLIEDRRDADLPDVGAGVALDQVWNAARLRSWRMFQMSLVLVSRMLPSEIERMPS